MFFFFHLKYIYFVWVIVIVYNIMCIGTNNLVIIYKLVHYDAFTILKSLTMIQIYFHIITYHIIIYLYTIDII